MEPIVSTLLLLGGASLASLLAARSERQLLSRLARTWRWAAAKAGLGIDESSFERDRGRQLSARVGDLTVVFRYAMESKRRGTWVAIEGLGHGEPGLTLRLETFEGRLGKLLGQPEVELGAFADRDLLIHGDEVLAQALLDAPTRAKLVRFLRGESFERQRPGLARRYTFEKGVLAIWLEQETHGRTSSEDKDLELALNLLLELAPCLTRPADLASRLADRLRPGARREPEAEARLKCLRLLAREFPTHAETAEALRCGLADPDEPVRLEAARASGREGVGVLRALAAAARSEAVAARAVEALGDRAVPAEVISWLESSLMAGRQEPAFACLALLGRFPRTGSPELAVVEEALLGGLGAQPVGIAVAAAESLGRAGTVAAVPSLREAAARGPRALSAAARQAIAAIQARLTGAEVGQVSLAGGEVGALSLTGEVAGRVSVVEAEKEPKARESPA